jgi:hypothetical protein
MVALELLPTAAVVTVKSADVAAATTVMEGATVSVALEFVRAMLAPPVGAAWVNLTVHVLVELAPMLVGLQASDETSTDAIRLTVLLAELLL